MDDVGIYQHILNMIETAIRPGAAALRQQLLFWFGLFLWLEVLRMCWACVYNGHLLPKLLETLLKGALIWWALAHFPDLLHGAVHLFTRLGLLVGGNQITAVEFLDPGSYLRVGWRVARVLYSFEDMSLTKVSFQLIGGCFLWLAIMASFAVMAVNVFVWQLEMLLASVMMLALLPALAFRSTAWMAQGALSYVINKAFRFGVGAAVAGLTFRLMDLLIVTKPFTLWRAVVAMIGGWAFAFLFWQVNKIASGLLAGMPQLTAGSLASAAIGSAVVTGAAGAAVLTGGAGTAAALLHGGRSAMTGSGALLSAAPKLPLLGSTRLGAAAGHLGGAITTHSKPLADRLGSWAKTPTRLTTAQGATSLRQFVDVARYIGQDHPGPGVRR